jgi:phosphate/sulfate permease
MDLYQGAIVILFTLAVSDLVVGVSNDAVNFLNSSVGSRVAPRHVIMIVASLGILAGVTFSSGMMEVARKGIFHPKFFTMPELMTVFLAVMLTDIVLLDLYNTFGLPTSTTVSIVFELLGAAVAVSFMKIVRAGMPYTELVTFINTAKALAIISGILLSVAVAFAAGALVQFVTRVIFTFEFQKRVKRYGALWGGVALASIVYFILIKGSKGASFITPETSAWIKGNAWMILGATFVFCAILLHLMILFTRVNILKLIVLVGTFALAMAFAANDLVNFIGVPLAGLSAYTVARGSGSMLDQTMEALQKPVQSNTLFLLVAGTVMVVTLWVSRKARTVTKTEVSLGRQDEGFERFETNALSQTIVRMVAHLFRLVRSAIPREVRTWIAGRFERAPYRPATDADGTAPAFDLVRASVNLMVASALISLATSMKLPLSTTYVTFMVAMGTSLSDQAWGRESAVFRVTGVLTVIGGWFFTAMMAFTVSSAVAVAIYFGRAPAVIGIACLALVLIFLNRRTHKSRETEEQAIEVFNLSKIQDATAAINLTFEHTGILLREVSRALHAGFEGLFDEDRSTLRAARKQQRQIQKWANINVANIFKVLRLLQREDVENAQQYAETISTLQRIAESQRDVIMRAYLHVANNHAGLLEMQMEELRQIRACITDLLESTAAAFLHKRALDQASIEAKSRQLDELIHEFDQNQIMRIQNNSSKTRLSILFYSFLWNSQRIARQTLTLVQIFQDPLAHRLRDETRAVSSREAPPPPA